MENKMRPLKFKDNAGVAQLVEQLICNQQAAGSNPVASSYIFNKIAKNRLKYQV
jgi:hypothetical protein